MITSKENSVIKHIKALSQKKYRDEYNQYIVEGVKMCLEAINNANIEQLLICSELLDNSYSQILEESIDRANLTTVEYVSESIFKSISDTQTPQGIMAICTKPAPKPLSDNVLFVLDDVQDPGNLGTIIRTLDSAGYKDLVVSSNTVDEFNTKVIRSTMGAIFRLNVVRAQGSLVDFISELKSTGYLVAVTSLEDSNSLYNIDFSKKMAIVMGNESKGVNTDILNMADIRIKIPMIGKTESLNVAVATGLVAYEKVRNELK